MTDALQPCGHPLSAIAGDAQEGTQYCRLCAIDSARLVPVGHKTPDLTHPMKTRPIIFSAASIRAILQGRKTQSCRVLRFPKLAYQPTADWVMSVHKDGKGTWVAWSFDHADLSGFTTRAYPDGGGFPCPYGSPGDRLWIREAWASITLAANEPADQLRPDGVPVRLLYRADAAPHWVKQVPWQSPLVMPRWASRLTLQIESVRALRLHTLTVEDIIAEGGPFGNAATADDDFAVEWDAINARRGVPWISNPWVWAITFSIGAHERGLFEQGMS